jgi:predicted nucleic acid-binding protein
VNKIIVDSSVIAEHLTTVRERSYLRELSGRYFCYTTVFSAIELFGAAKSLKETQAVQDAMDALKVLGINPKSAKNIGAVLSSSQKQGLTALTVALCMESRLPIVTLEPRRYAGMKKLVVISAKNLLQ